MKLYPTQRDFHLLGHAGISPANECNAIACELVSQTEHFAGRFSTSVARRYSEFHSVSSQLFPLSWPMHMSILAVANVGIHDNVSKNTNFIIDNSF